MKTIKHVLLVMLITLNHAAWTQNKQGYPPVVLEKIRAVENNLVSWVKLGESLNFNIHQRMRELGINGAVVAVIHNYRIEWVKAYGWADTTHKKRMKTTTLFQPASIGKSLNGLGYMMLVRDHRVDLHTDINRYLKRWTFPYDSIAQGKKITIGNLLSHTAGLSVHGFDGYEWNTPLPTILQTLDGKYPANNPPVRSEIPPGMESRYSGGGIEIGEVLLEDVTGMDYAKYMKTKVFSPLKMERTSFTTDPIDDNYATGYRFDRKAMPGGYMKFTERACGGALWTTATDLARFVIGIQRSLKGKQNNILQASMVDTMLTPYLEGSNAALGYFIEKKGSEKYFQHSGLNPGYSSQYYGSMENGNGVVVLVNSDMTDFMAEVVNAVATVYHWKDFYPYVPKKIITLPADSLKRFAGKYLFENASSGPEIVYENGRLFLADPNSPVRWNMYFSSPRDFFMLEAKWVNQQFFFDEHSKVAGFKIIGDSYQQNVIKVN